MDNSPRGVSQIYNGPYELMFASMKNPHTIGRRHLEFNRWRPSDIFTSND